MDTEMNITQAQYYTRLEDATIIEGIKATIDGVEMSVPLCEGNRHYDEIMRQVNAGTLTIQAAQAATQQEAE